jgi:hypothetical protein
MTMTQTLFDPPGSVAAASLRPPRRRNVLIFVMRQARDRVLRSIESAMDGACECALAGEAVTLFTAEVAAAVLALRERRNAATGKS